MGKVYVICRIWLHSSEISHACQQDQVAKIKGRRTEKEKPSKEVVPRSAPQSPVRDEAHTRGGSLMCVWPRELQDPRLQSSCLHAVQAVHDWRVVWETSSAGMLEESGEPPFPLLHLCLSESHRPCHLDNHQDSFRRRGS